MQHRTIFIAALLSALIPFTAFALEANSSESTQGHVSIRSTASNIVVSANFGDLDLQPSSLDALMGIEGEDRIGAPGAPDLPCITRLLVVPPSVGVELEVTCSTPRIVSGAEPSSYPTEYNNGKDLYPAANIESSGFWPSAAATIDPPVIMRGVRLVRVAVTPVQYDRSTGQYRIYDHVEATLKFTGEAVNPVINPDRPRPSSVSNRLLRSLVGNPETLRRDDPAERGAFVYVIPNVQGVAEAIQPLVDWRRKEGIPTTVIAVAANASNVDVKNALQDAYDNWEIPPENICLIGDADLIAADFMIPTWDVGRAYMWETDYKYALLEGQDLLPEAAIGRISARNINELRDVVTKIVGYETNPYMDETDWFQRAAVMANDPRTGYSSLYLQRWARNLFQEVGFAEVDTFFFIHDNQETDHDFIRRNINTGISVFNYRGWGQFNGAWTVGQSGELRNAGKMPLMILPTCNTCDFADHILAEHSYAEDFLWARGGGAIGTIGSSGFTHTNYNNVLDGGMLNGLYRDQIYQIGWALNKGKLELYRHFGLFHDVDDPQVQNLLVWEAHCYQFNLIGDSGTELWTGIPKRLDVLHADTLGLGGASLTVSVNEGDNALAGAMVTLVQSEEILRSELTPVSGELVFSFAPGDLAEGDLFLTVSGHNLKPYFDTLAVVQANRSVGALTVVIDDDNAGRSRGNGNRAPNPGETLELRTYIGNFGSEALDGALDLTLTLIEGSGRIVNGQAHLDNSPNLGDSTVVTFIVEVGFGNPNGARLLFNLDAVEGQTAYPSSFAFTVGAADLEYVRHAFTPQVFQPGDTAWVDITLRNQGAVSSPAMHARLVSLTQEVSVFNDRADYPAVSLMNDDSLGTARFRIYAHSLTVPGAKAKLLLLLETDAGLRDTASFEYVISAPEDDTPFGPDNYGYVCFDDLDTRWDTAPTYNWIEIDTALGGVGIDTDIRDRGNEQDWSVLIDLPFNFRYYGRDFRELTICSNGWFAFGDESKLADFQNRRIPPALGPRAQVCVFWDDLVSYMDTTDRQIGGVFYHFDADSNRFIIEWSRIRRYVGLQGDTMMRAGGENTFQAILYDPQHYPTYTGDGDITLQYRTVHNDVDVDPGEFDTPHATVGIVNLNGTDGMEYTYWNEYHPGAARLQDGRAIKFSTKLIVVVGYVRGNITDASTGQPIPNAEIRGSRGSFGLTDRTGRFFLDNVLVGDDYSFTAWAPGYNDSTLSEIDIVEGDTISLNFALLHPGFNISRDSVSVAVRPGYGTDAVINLTNSGTGPLTFRSQFDYGNQDEDLWRRLLNVDVTAATGDNRIQGVGFYNGLIWVTGSNNNQNPNRFYLFRPDGTPTGYLPQPGSTAYGFRGITSDGELLWGGEGAWLVGVNADAEAVDSIPAPLSIQRALAYDANDSCFWVANGRSDPLVKIDRQGNILESHQLELDITGLAFFPTDPDDYTLYILSRDRTNPTLQIPQALISKFNPLTGDLRVVTPLEGEVVDQGGGMVITSHLDPTKWVLLAIMNNAAGHRFSGYDIGPNTSWVSYEPRAGQLAPGASTEIQLDINTEELAVGDYRLNLRYMHNAAGLKTDIPIHLEVNENAGLKDAAPSPTDFSLHEAFPNPFNATTVIPFSLPRATKVNLALYDLTGREALRLINGQMSAGEHSVLVEASDLSSGIYLVRLEADGMKASTKVALIK